MRVAGSPEGCEETARGLQRAAAEVARTADALHQAEVSGWVGASAQGWSHLASRRVTELRALAHVLGGFGRVVQQHAAELASLQDRARRLSVEAAEAGLVLDERGEILPVALPESPDLVREALHQREVRRCLLAAVAEVRARESDLHERLRAGLAAVHDTPAAGPDAAGGVDAAWAPNRWDLPSAAVSAAQALGTVTDRVPAVLRHARAAPGVGMAVGLAVDLRSYDVPDALTKGALVTGTSVVGGMVLAATAPAWLAVAGGGAVALGVGKAFDAVGHRLLPWVQKPSTRTWWVRHTAAAPGVVRTPSPTPGPRPTPTPAARSGPSRPQPVGPRGPAVRPAHVRWAPAGAAPAPRP